MRFTTTMMFLAWASSALAQQPPVSPEVQSTIAVLQQQRNTAMDQAAGFHAQAIVLKKELDDLKASKPPTEK